MIAQTRRNVRIDPNNLMERQLRLSRCFFFLGLFDTRLFEFKSLTFFFLSFCQVWSAPSFSFLRRIINPRINQTDERHTHTHEKKNRIQNREQKVARLVRVHHEFHSVTEQEKKKIRKKIVFRPSSDEFSLALGCLFVFLNNFFKKENIVFHFRLRKETSGFLVHCYSRFFFFRAASFEGPTKNRFVFVFYASASGNSSALKALLAFDRLLIVAVGCFPSSSAIPIVSINFFARP